VELIKVLKITGKIVELCKARVLTSQVVWYKVGVD